MTSPIQVQQIDHVTLVVADLDVSRAFYVDLLGMVEVPRPAFEFEGAWFQAGATLVHLIKTHDESGPAGFYPAAKRTTRMWHLAFEVEDAVAAGQFLKQANADLVSDVKARPDGAAQVFVADPDGYIVELCSTPKSSF